MGFPLFENENGCEARARFTFHNSSRRELHSVGWGQQTLWRGRAFQVRIVHDGVRELSLLRDTPPS